MRNQERRKPEADSHETGSLYGYCPPGADFYFSTDFDDYAEDVAEHIRHLHGYRSMLATPWVYSLPEYPISKYMQRFLDRGQQIYYIHYRRDEAVPIEELPTAEASRGYRASWQKVEND